MRQAWRRSSSCDRITHLSTQFPVPYHVPHIMRLVSTLRAIRTRGEIVRLCTKRVTCTVLYKGGNWVNLLDTCGRMCAFEVEERRDGTREGTWRQTRKQQRNSGPDTKWIYIILLDHPLFPTWKPIYRFATHSISNRELVVVVMYPQHTHSATYRNEGLQFTFFNHKSGLPSAVLCLVLNVTLC